MIENNTTPTELNSKDEANVIDIKLSQRKTFRIDGDNNKLLSLDISDLNVITRLNEAYPKMRQSALEASDRLSKAKLDDEDTDVLQELADALKGIDDGMREQIDYVFDAPVSEVCAPKGTMYDPYNGEFRFEHIITALAGLYSNNLSDEFVKMKQNVNKHTSKYTKRSKK